MQSHKVIIFSFLSLFFANSQAMENEPTRIEESAQVSGPKRSDVHYYDINDKYDIRLHDTNELNNKKYTITWSNFFELRTLKNAFIGALVGIGLTSSYDYSQNNSSNRTTIIGGGLGGVL